MRHSATRNVVLNLVYSIVLIETFFLNQLD